MSEDREEKIANGEICGHCEAEFEGANGFESLCRDCMSGTCHGDESYAGFRESAYNKVQ